MTLAERTPPNIVLMDIRMPELDGLEATRQIIERMPWARVLILTTYDLDVSSSVMVCRRKSPTTMSVV